MSNIGWTDITWNPVTGCSKVSPGCRNCYALHMSHRLSHNPQAGDKYEATTEKTGKEPQWSGQVRLHHDALVEPLSLKKPRRIFVCSMSDLFHPDVPNNFIIHVFVVMAACPQHQFQVLTKRPDRMQELLSDTDFSSFTRAAYETNQKRGIISHDQPFPSWPLQNVWLGTSVEDQKRADERIPYLTATPAGIHFLSCEPLLGGVNLQIKSHQLGIDWVIAGGESGPNARPMHPDWVRNLKDQCDEAGIAFFFKQWGEYIPYEGLPIPLNHVSKIKYYWDQYDFLKVKADNPASVLKRYPIACKVGKHEAGNLLDGRKHEEYPKAKEVTYADD